MTVPSLRNAETPAVRAPARAVRPSRSAAVLAVQAHALAQSSFEAAAAAVVNQLAQMLPCERVSLGLYVGGRLRIVAVSGAADVREKHNAVRRIAAAMAEALDQRLAIVHPLPGGASPAITLAHQDLAQSNGHAALYTVPVATRHELLGALLFERRGGFDTAALEAAKDAAMFAGPLLALKQRADDRVGHRVAQALRPSAQRPFGGARFSVARAAIAATLIGVAALALVPSTQRVVAPARVEGAVQQVIAAPVDGFVGAVQVRPGETVKAGQVLMSLDTRELALDRDKWAAEMAQLDKQYREALSKDEAAPIMIARAKLEQAQSQHELAVQQLERSTLRAPIDGVVLSGDFTQAIGMPLKRGQELLDDRRRSRLAGRRRSRRTGGRAAARRPERPGAVRRGGRRRAAGVYRDPHRARGHAGRRPQRLRSRRHAAGQRRPTAPRHARRGPHRGGREHARRDLVRARAACVAPAVVAGAGVR